MSGKHLKDKKYILLVRMENGWYIRDNDTNYKTDPKWVFESTKSLCKQLPDIIGESGWTVIEQPRDPSGKFQPKQL